MDDIRKRRQISWFSQSTRYYQTAIYSILGYYVFILDLLPTILLHYFFGYKLKHGFIIFLFLLLFNISIFVSAFFYHSFIDKIQTGSIIMKILYLGVSVFGLIFVKPGIPMYYTVLFSLFPNFKCIKFTNCHQIRR